MTIHNMTTQQVVEIRNRKYWNGFLHLLLNLNNLSTLIKHPFDNSFRFSVKRKSLHDVLVFYAKPRWRLPQIVHLRTNNIVSYGINEISIWDLTNKVIRYFMCL